MGYYTVCVSHLGFLEPESPNFDPNHAFLSSIEADIITFLPKKAAIFFFLAFTSVLYIFQCGSPSRIDSEAPESPHTKNGAFIRSVTVIRLRIDTGG